MRRLRRNPGLVLPLAALAAIGVGVFLATRKKDFITVVDSTTGREVIINSERDDGSGTPFAVEPDPSFFTATAAQLQAQVVRQGGRGCFIAVNGVGGLNVAGVPSGQNVLFRVQAASTDGGKTIMATPIDPRLPTGMPPVAVPGIAFSGGDLGAGDCSATILDLQNRF